MNGTRLNLLASGLDGLRLFGIGRVPRCAGCPRYDALVSAHQARLEREDGPPTALPDVPAYCSFQICAPLTRRPVSTRETDPAPARATHPGPYQGLLAS